MPAAGRAQTIAFGAFCELPQYQPPGTAATAGDSGSKVRTSSGPAEKQKKLAAGIAIGRLAMMAIIGMFFQARREHDVLPCDVAVMLMFVTEALLGA